MKCISCNFEHEQNFCPNCGEKNGIERITFSSIIQNGIASIVNMDKGFLFNLKTLFINPKQITFDYLKGKRRGIFNPISYLIYAVTFYILVFTIFDIPPETIDTVTVPKKGIGKIAYQVGMFIGEYLKYYWILCIVPFAFSLKVVFKRFNFPEHLTISSFIIGQATLLGLFSYLFLRLPLIADPVIYLAIYWLTFKIFQRKNNLIESLVLPLVTIILFVFQLIVINIAIGILIA